MTKKELCVLSIVVAIEIFMGYGGSVTVEYVASASEKVVYKVPEVLKPNFPNTPKTVKAVYLTSWSAGSQKRIDSLIDLAKTTNMNAVVIDIKDSSGEVAYKTNIPEVIQYNSQFVKIKDLQLLLKKLHEANLYIIARIVVFQDPLLSKARPDLAILSIEQNNTWTDYKGVSWVDPASEEVWSYNAHIAKNALDQGFDEINFDYVRFPSDGNLQDMKFPLWDKAISREEVLKKFFAYLREYLKGFKISLDIFGLTTVKERDFGVGQVIEDALEYFDYVCPMVYPSHYASSFHGYENPAEYPYEVVKFSLESGLARLETLRKTYPEKQFAVLRPWLQDFDIGAEYNALMVQAQIQASVDALQKDFFGFSLWAPDNKYEKETLTSFEFDATAYQNRSH